MFRPLTPLLAWLALALIPSSAYAQLLVRQVNLAELSQRAAIIVQGRVVEVSYEGHPDYPNLHTVRVTLQVERMFRGDSVEYLIFREYLPGPRPSGGKRGYVAGQRLLLFLPQPSRYGLSSPLGREQGRFRIFWDVQGKEVVVNDFGNAGLFRDVAQTARQAGLSLSPEETRLTSVKRGSVHLEHFLSLVERLSSLPHLR